MYPFNNCRSQQSNSPPPSSQAHTTHISPVHKSIITSNTLQPIFSPVPVISLIYFRYHERILRRIRAATRWWRIQTGRRKPCEEHNLQVRTSMKQAGNLTQLADINKWHPSFDHLITAENANILGFAPKESRRYTTELRANILGFAPKESRWYTTESHLDVRG